MTEMTREHIFRQAEGDRLLLAKQAASESMYNALIVLVDAAKQARDASGNGLLEAAVTYGCSVLERARGEADSEVSRHG
jgi:hypothetical protein